MPDLPYVSEVTIEMLLASPLHRYEGRPSDGPRDATSRELFESVEVKANRGIVGDRYFGHQAHISASVTIMAIESLEALGMGPLDPADTRRNIIVRGMDIDAMRGQEFELGGVLFRANRPANPCAWMDVTLGEGAFRGLRGHGGMRCQPLTSGTLHLGPAVLRSQHPLAARLF